VGVNQVAVLHHHAVHAHFLAVVVEMRPGVARCQRTGQGEEARRPLRDVTDAAVGNDTQRTEPLVYRALHLAPEGTVTDFGTVEVLDHSDGRAGPGGNVLVVADALVARG